MDDHKDYEIRQRAYVLWEQAGKPHGKHLDYWLQAEREFAGEDKLEEGLQDTFPASDAPASTMRSAASDERPA